MPRRTICPDGDPYTVGQGCARCGYGRRGSGSGQQARIPRSSAERKRRAQAVADHRATFGDVCPGYRVPAHRVVPPNFLTADHIRPTSMGGAPDGELRVVCNECNVRKGGKNRLRGRS